MIRTDFVSNSSSASFVINREQHGCWFNQAFGIINKLNEDWIDKMYITFENKIDYSLLIPCLELITEPKDDDCSRKFLAISTSTNCYCCNKYYKKLFYISTNNKYVLNKIPKQLMDKILQLEVSLEDDCDIGKQATTFLYNMLEETGLPFEFIR